jgi:hypothetical protein
VLLALSAGYDRLGWSPEVSRWRGGFVLLGQAVLVVWALRAWALVARWARESRARPRWAPSESVLPPPCRPLRRTSWSDRRSAVMLIGASVIALAV